jgi:multidrug resistance efflux pump
VIRADVEELPATLEQLRAELEVMTRARDDLQVFADGCSHDLGSTISDMLTLRWQYDEAVAECDRLRGQLEGLGSELEMLQRRLLEETGAHAQVAAQLAEVEAEVGDLRIEVQRDGNAPRGRFAFGRRQGGRPGVPSAAPPPPAVAPVGPVEPVEDALNRRLFGDAQP